MHYPMRRIMLRIAVALATSVLGLAHAQGFPSKPIRWVVVAPAGSSLDVIARATQEKLREQLGQPIVIENRPQAGGTVGTAEVAHAPADGHTWVLSYNGPLSFAPLLYPKLSYDPLRDLQPVTLTTSQPNVIAVNAQLPVSSLRDLVALMQREPGRLNFASVGNGSSSHLTIEYLKTLTQTFAVHIPFNGSPPAVLATASGETQLMAAVPTAVAPQVRQGRLKYLAVTSLQRYSLLPEVPTVAESGLPALRGFEALAWNGVLVPTATPRPVVERIHQALSTALNEPSTRERLQAAGLEPVGTGPEAFKQLIQDEARKWAPVIRRSGARLD